MNNLLRAVCRINGSRALFAPFKTTIAPNLTSQRHNLARNLWYLSASNKNFTNLCSCGCGSRNVHSQASTAAEKNLVEFLTEEILSERKGQKSKTLPTELEGFKVQLKGAEVFLTKQLDNETVKISFNVNHSVDSDVEPDIDSNMDKPELGELRSKPDFQVEISRGSTTLRLLCSFLNPSQQEDGYNDVYGLDEMSIYEGELNDNIYSLAGDAMDSCMYDLILNYLEEKGLSNEFVEKLADYSTGYEHSAYIGLLEGLSKFASGK